MKQIEFGMDRLYSDFNNCGFFKKFEIIDKKEENDLIKKPDIKEELCYHLFRDLDEKLRQRKLSHLLKNLIMTD